jgi:hypothetical protein
MTCFSLLCLIETVRSSYSKRLPCFVIAKNLLVYSWIHRHLELVFNFDEIATEECTQETSVETDPAGRCIGYYQDVNSVWLYISKVRLRAVYICLVVFTQRIRS